MAGWDLKLAYTYLAKGKSYILIDSSKYVLYTYLISVKNLTFKLKIYILGSLGEEAVSTSLICAAAVAFFFFFLKRIILLKEKNASTKIGKMEDG